MRRAIAADFAALPGDRARVVVTLDSRLPDDPGPWTIERIDPGQAPHRVRELAGMADFTVLVAPETTGILARLTREFQAAGARVLGSSPDAIDLTGNKDRLARWFFERGIPTPRSRIVIPAAGLPADTEYPAVLKPIDGAGSVDTYYLSERECLPADACKLPVALLQPFVPGVPMSASFLVDQRGQGLAHRDWDSARCRPGRPVRVSGRAFAVIVPIGRTAAPPGGGIHPGPSRVRRRRFPLGRGTTTGDGPGNQSEADDLMRRADPALAPGAPRRGLARGLRSRAG